MARSDQLPYFEKYLDKHYPDIYLKFSGHLAYPPIDEDETQFSVAITMGKQHFTQEEQNIIFKAWKDWESSYHGE